jgi:hypothetical protein
MCSTPDRWIGYMAFKLNLDSNCDRKVDQIRLLQYIDKSGLNNGKPRNDWVLTFSRTFSLNEIGLKSKIQSYVEDIGHPEYRYQTLRIDGQSQSEWQSTTNPPYKFVTLKQITNIQKDDGSCTVTSSSPAATREATTTERTTPTSEGTGDDAVTSEGTGDDEVTGTATGEEEEDTASTPSSSSSNNNNNNNNDNNNNDNGRRGETIGGGEEEEEEVEEED